MMKSLIPLLLSLLLFCGCAPQNPPEETTVATIPHEEAAPVQTVLTMILSQEDGAVRRFQLSEAITGFLPMEQGLLFFSGQDMTTLTLIHPETGQAAAVYETSILLTPENFTVQVLTDSISFFDSTAMETVVLDNALRLIRKIPAPEGLQGAPLLSSDGGSLFYCTADAVRVLDLKSGISRVLKEASYPVQGLSGLLLEDTVLQVSITDTDGSWYTLFLSSETGQLLQEAQGNVNPETFGSGFWIEEDSLVRFGSTDGTSMLFQPRLTDADCFFLPEGFRTVTAAAEDGCTVLELYDLATGCRKAILGLDGLTVPHNVCTGTDGRIWFLSENTLFRWDSAASGISDTTLYIAPYYTRQEPDYEGLAACALLADAISEKYGIETLIYKDAVATEPWDYHLEYEYQPAVLRRELEALDARLGNFPEGFLQKLSSTFTGLQICLVQDITAAPGSGSPEDVSGIQFLEGYDAYIALNCSQNTEQALYHELCHLMETVVLTESAAYDRWDNLNPEGFAYGPAPDREWLQPGREWFIDSYSMTNAREDRARIFEYAMTAGHEDLFRSPPLQMKLRQLCLALREAFELERYEGRLLWEQYLVP